MDGETPISLATAPTINFGYHDPKGKVVFDNQPEAINPLDPKTTTLLGLVSLLYKFRNSIIY